MALGHKPPLANYPRPPAHLAPYVRILGVQGAIEFFLTFGGGEIYLASNPKGRARLVEMVGPDKAAALAEAIARLKVRVPTAKPWIAACFKSEGLPVAEIARRLHVADKTVWGWIRGTHGGLAAGDGDDGKDPRQLSLF